MRKISITGGSGYIGKFLVADLLNQGDCCIKVLSRTPAQFNFKSDRFEVIQGDLCSPESLLPFVDEESIVINLAFNRGARVDINVGAAQNLLNICVAKGVKKFIHCSTVTVESAGLSTISEYSKTKLRVEQEIERYAKGNMDYAILRPSAVFGPDSKNLSKLCKELTTGSKALIYLKGCLNGKRRMNLVEVSNVVKAFSFLIHRSDPLCGEKFIISDSDSSQNNFLDVERILIRELGIRGFPLPRLVMPSCFLNFLLNIRAVDYMDPNHDYLPNKILLLGFKRPTNFEDGLIYFARHYKDNQKLVD